MNKHYFNLNNVILLFTLLAILVPFKIFAKPFSGTQTRYTNLGLGCHIRAAIPFGGGMGGAIQIADFPYPNTYREFSMNLDCYKIEDGLVQGWAEYDKHTQKWVRRFIDEEDKKQRQALTKLYPIQAKNSQGYVVTEDDFTGYEWQRERRMHFCLLHPPKALCGEGTVMKLNDKKSNVFPYILKIVRSIEFLDKKTSDTQVQETNLGLGCHIRATIPFGGDMADNTTKSNGGSITIEKFPSPNPYRNFSTTLQCLNIKDIDFPKGTNVRYDAQKKIWVKDFSQRSYAHHVTNYKKLDKASDVYTIQAKNASGYVYTEDDLTDYEWRRNRIMHFCLLHPPKVLCGKGIVIKSNDPKTNVLPYVLDIVRSIEFIEDKPVQKK